MRTPIKREEIYCTNQANVKVKFNNYWQTMRNITREWCHQSQEGDVALETRPFWQGIYNRTKMQPLLKRNAPLPHVYYLKIGETRSLMFLVLSHFLTILRNVTIFKTVIHLSLRWAVLFLLTLNRFDSLTIITNTSKFADFHWLILPRLACFQSKRLTCPKKKWISNALFDLYFQTFINFNRPLPLSFHVISMREFLYNSKVFPF